MSGDIVAAYRERLRDDFRFFLWEIFEFKGYNRPSIAPLSEVELDMADFAANYRAPGSRTHETRLVAVGGTRGIGKTYLVTAGVSAWRYYRNPDREILIVSKSSPAAIKTARLVREWLGTIPFLQHLSPPEGGLDNALTFNVNGRQMSSRQPSMTVVGIGGMTENNRAHTIIADDIETVDNSMTVDSRERLRVKAEEFVHILYPEKSANVGDPQEIIYVQTPKHEDTVLLDLQARGFSVRGYPIAYPREDQKVISLAPFLVEHMRSGKASPGDPTMPRRFGRDHIEKAQSASRLTFDKECMLIADMSEKNRFPLRLSDLMVIDVPRVKGPVALTYGQSNNKGSTRLSMQTICFDHDGLYAPAIVDEVLATYASTKAAIDPAGRGTDKTGLAIASQLSGLVYVHECLGLPGGFSDEKVDKIILMCRDYGVTHLVYENNIDGISADDSGGLGFIGRALQQAIDRHRLKPNENPNFPAGWQCVLEPMHNQGQKELRIIGTLEPIMSQHRLVIDRRAIELSEDDQALELQYQLTHLTKERKCLTEDGKIDALEMVVRMHQQGVTRPTRSAQIAHMLRELERNEERRMELLGIKRTRASANAFRRGLVSN